ncbi:WD40 repeat-like protein [Macrolepiota fuliginosa MF-IS2]|uniref:WD40 repeat-like protein n=1 Tax=Macrolepiota fuliginosa MF-IS2 TaxID=1400762 RepID=A0A9P5XNP2_9AGAR|nr:WD40 repeat-like protein [Macrolepiota fuliginosa MF-IS2]
MSSKKGKAKENPAKSSSDHTLVQGVSTSWDGKEVPWEWASITSPGASKVSPIFTKDGSYFFSLVGSSVQIHSVATGQVVSTLAAPNNKTAAAGLSNSFSCAVINPHNPFQLITGSLDGCLMIWDFLDGTLLRTIDVTQPIHLICAHEQYKDYVFVAASRPSKKAKQDNNAVVMRVSLQLIDASTNSTSLRSAEVSAVGKTRFPTGLAISPNGTWLVATAGHKVYVAKTSALAAGFTKYVSPERLTCLAFHPSEEYFATGDDKGVIRLWYCLNDELAVRNAKGVEKKTQTSSMHWHAHAVSALAFTSNGAYLLSGGEEAVLVIWQLQTGRKEYVPRVGSAVNTVSVTRSKAGEEEYLLGLADATYVFVNAGSLKILRSYSRVKIDPGAYIHDPSPSKCVSTPLAVHTLSSTILLPSSHPSSLQVYSPSTSTLVSELEVSPSNRISRREDKAVEHSRIERCIISPSGHWMVTVDTREGDCDFRAEVYLKFWSWDERNAAWALNTRIDKPHADKKITSLAFSPEQGRDTMLQLVSAGEDGIVKVWRLRSRKLKGGEREEFWAARTTLKYHSEKPRFAAWSQDGSLLAVCYEACVVIYETTLYAVLQSLTSSECTSPYSVYFIGGRHLVVGGGTQIVLWDILMHTITWHHSAANKIQSIMPHPSGSSFAIFEEIDSEGSETTRISTFSLQSPKPTKICTLPFTLRSKAWYTGSAQPSQYSFLGISRSWSLIAFGDSVNLAPEDNSAKELSTDTAVRKPTLLQDIFGSSAFVDLTNLPSSGPAQYQVPSSSKSAEDIFDTSAYLMPAINTFFDPLIHTFLKKRVTEDEPLLSDASKMDVDEEEVEEDVAQVVTIAVSRTVTSSEINDLIGLFRKQAIQDPAPSHAAKNSGKTVNGRDSSTPNRCPPPKSKFNGISSKTKTPVAAASDDTPETPDPSSSPQLVNGRKRKKP